MEEPFSSFSAPSHFLFYPSVQVFLFFWRESQAEEKRKAEIIFPFPSFSSKFPSTRFFRSLFAAFLLLNTETAVLWKKAPMRAAFFLLFEFPFPTF